MLPKNRNKRKYFQNNFAQSEKNCVKRKWLEKMNQLKKHILFFDFLENHYVSKDEVSKQHLNVIKKSNFVKADKTMVRSSHPPLETVLITCQDQKTEVKASPFKIADDQTPITSIIEQNNFINESLHVIGQQLDRIEEKIVEKTVSVEKPVFEKSVSVKTEKPLIHLPSQREKVMFKTSQSKTLEIVEKILSDLKIKIEGTSRSTACTISRNGKEIVSDENTNFDIVSSVSAKMIFDDDLPKIKDLLEIPNPCLLQRTGIQDLLLLICSLKKDIFKHSFLFLLISFMNGILMVCQNKKSLIKWVICLWLVLLIKIIMILINLKLLIYLLLVFLVLFVDGGIHIS